jgi:hypothetical protein
VLDNIGRADDTSSSGDSTSKASTGGRIRVSVSRVVYRPLESRGLLAVSFPDIYVDLYVTLPHPF